MPVQARRVGTRRIATRCGPRFRAAEPDRQSRVAARDLGWGPRTGIGPQYRVVDTTVQATAAGSLADLTTRGRRGTRG